MSTDERPRGVPWWAAIALATALTASVGVTSYVGQGLIGMRIEQAEMKKDLERIASDLNVARGQIATFPTTKDLESLRSEINNLRSDLRDARAEFKERRPR